MVLFPDLLIVSTCRSAFAVPQVKSRWGDVPASMTLTVSSWLLLMTTGQLVNNFHFSFALSSFVAKPALCGAPTLVKTTERGLYHSFQEIHFATLRNACFKYAKCVCITDLPNT